MSLPRPMEHNAAAHGARCWYGVRCQARASIHITVSLPPLIHATLSRGSYATLLIHRTRNTIMKCMETISRANGMLSITLSFAHCQWWSHHQISISLPLSKVPWSGNRPACNQLQLVLGRSELSMIPCSQYCSAPICRMSFKFVQLHLQEPSCPPTPSTTGTSQAIFRCS